MSFKRESRYTVLKNKDIEAYLNESEIQSLIKITNKIKNGRSFDGKKPIKCVVVEHDWPEYEPTWKAIENRVGESK